MENKWGTYNCIIQYGADYIHPNDFEVFIKIMQSGSKVYECIGKEGEYILIKYREDVYRVKEEMFNIVPIPKYNFGEIVKLKKNGEEAIIIDIMWHYKNKAHFYLIIINNKKKSKRYYEDEFIKL